MSPRILARAVPSIAFLGLCFIALSPAAASSPADSEAWPDTWDMTLEELQAVGLGQSRGDPIPVPAGAPRLRAPDEPPQGGRPCVIFVNFDGAQLSSGFDDSRNNVTQISQLVGSYAAYGQGTKREAVMQAVRQDWSDYNCTIRDDRPASGDYVMNMTGPNNSFGSGVLGIAPLDCNDSQTHNNITFAFHSEDDFFTAPVQATTIGQEVAHSFGLEHVNFAGDIMNPNNAGGDASFNDQCITLSQGASCASQHAAHCASGAQNAHQELLSLFGPSTPDAAPPSVQITNPVDGQEFAEGANFEIQVTATDDTDVEQVILYNNGAEAQRDTSQPYGWSITSIPAGTYEFYVEALDVAGNSSMSNIVTVYVDTEAPPGDDNDGLDDDGGDGGGGGGTGGDDDGDGDDGGGEADGGGSDGGGDGDDGGDGGGNGGGGGNASAGGLPGGYGQDDVSTDGCACRTTDAGRRGGPAASLLGLFGFLLARRRRTRP